MCDVREGVHFYPIDNNFLKTVCKDLMMLQRLKLLVLEKGHRLQVVYVIDSILKLESTLRNQNVFFISCWWVQSTNVISYNFSYLCIVFIVMYKGFFFFFFIRHIDTVYIINTLVMYCQSTKYCSLACVIFILSIDYNCSTRGRLLSPPGASF